MTSSKRPASSDRSPPSQDLPRELPRSFQEQGLDDFIRFLEGPVNRRAEKVMKSKWVLTPLGVGWTLWSRSLIAVRDRKVGRLFQRISPDEAKRRWATRP